MVMQSDASLLVSLPCHEDFVRLARRGLFAYDWQDVHRTRGFSWKYEMIARPESPIQLDQMPQEMQELLRNTRFGSIRYSDCLTVDVQRDLDCVSV